MELERTHPHRGAGAAALEQAGRLLAAIGFKLVAAGRARVEAEGPGMRSTRQELLLGANRVVIEERGGNLWLGAELKPFARLAAIGRWLPVIVVGANAIFLSVILALTKASLAPALIVVGGAVALIAILFFAMRAAMARTRRRVEQSFQTLLENAVALAHAPRTA